MSATDSYISENPNIVPIPRILTKEFLTTYGAELLGKKTHLFFDYDEDEKNNIECKDDAYCKKKAKEIRDKLEGASTNWTHPFVMTEAKQPNKVSFHVVFTNPKDVILRADFKKEWEEELFSSIVGKDKIQYIDHQVYGKK
jgi:hypothetical protein